jgi:microcystin-dependent protein
MQSHNMGKLTGEETHATVISEMPIHDHGCNHRQVGASGYSEWTISPGSNQGNTRSYLTGGSQAHNNMQPTLFVGNLFIFSGV